MNLILQFLEVISFPFKFKVTIGYDGENIISGFMEIHAIYFINQS